jgi:hypothetical protein
MRFTRMIKPTHRQNNGKVELKLLITFIYIHLQSLEKYVLGNANSEHYFAIISPSTPHPQSLSQKKK